MSPFFLRLTISQQHKAIGSIAEVKGLADNYKPSFWAAQAGYDGDEAASDVSEFEIQVGLGCVMHRVTMLLQPISGLFKLHSSYATHFLIVIPC